MTMNNKSTYKTLLILSSIFFIGMTAFGIIPSLITDVSIWEQSLLLKGFSIIFGLSFIISMISYIYIALASLKPFSTITNYMKILHIIMLLSLYIYILPDDTNIDNIIKIIIFLFFGLIIIITDLVYYLKAKSNQSKKEINNKEIIIDFKPITNRKGGTSIFNLVFSVVLMLALSNENIRLTVSYVMIILLNTYIIYYFLKVTFTNKVQKKIIIVSSIILAIFTIVLLEITTNILGEFEFVIALLPSMYLFPKILKNFYVINWLNQYE